MPGPLGTIGPSSECSIGAGNGPAAKCAIAVGIVRSEDQELIWADIVRG